MRKVTYSTGLCLALLGLVSLAGAPASAQVFTQNGTGLASPSTTITFDEVALPLGSPVGNAYSAYGVTFSSGANYSPAGGGYPNIDNSNIGNFYPTVTPTFINFNQDVSAAAFAMITNPGTSTFTAYLDGVVVGTGTTATTYTDANNFFGFTGGLFDSIQIDSGGLDGSFLADNLQFSPGATVTPEGSSLLLLTGGFVPIGVLLGLRRARRTK